MAEASNSENSSSMIVVLTGVSTGIGRACLEKLLANGFCVFGSVRKQTDADRIAGEVGNLLGKFKPLIFDVTDSAGIAAAVQKVSEELNGRTLAALINNAGVNVGPDPTELICLDKFRTQLEVNLVAPVAITQAFLPLLGTDLARSGPPGRVLFMGSIYGSYSLPWQAAYCATKRGLEGISESLRLELMQFGIEVIIIRPGPVRSEIWDKSMKPEVAQEGGAGDWAAYKTSQYAEAMAATRKHVLSNMETADFFLPCEAIASCVLQAIRDKKPRLQVVETSRYMENWFLPCWTPVRIRDQAIAKKLGLK